jgi:hypothetical protein
VEPYMMHEMLTITMYFPGVAMNAAAVPHIFPGHDARCQRRFSANQDPAYCPLRCPADIAVFVAHIRACVRAECAVLKRRCGQIVGFRITRRKIKYQPLCAVS